MYKNVTVISRKMDLPQHAVQRWRHYHTVAAAVTCKMRTCGRAGKTRTKICGL